MKYKKIQIFLNIILDMIILKNILKQQNINYENENNFGKIELSYLDQKSETDTVVK